MKKYINNKQSKEDYRKQKLARKQAKHKKK